jgi:predicted DsbA family dithiol-disulfide isomerase
MNHTAQATTLKIDFVSDIACPWCAVGLGALEQALASIAATNPEIKVNIHFQPFQLNPDMPPEGQAIGEHLTGKYGSTAAQQEQTYAMIRERGAEVGFDFRLGGRGRTWNTFDCHRLLMWAESLANGSNGADRTDASDGISVQHRMKQEMLKSYFSEGHNPAARDVLLGIVSRLNLDTVRAAAILDSDDYTAEVRTKQAFYRSHQINSVPAVIINERHLISGGQPAATFENALRQIASEP